jgi:hypothetical protein
MEAVKPGTRWTVTVPGGAWVSYTHAVDPAEPWRAAGAVTGDGELVGAVEVTMAGSDEWLDGPREWVGLTRANHPCIAVFLHVALG